MKLLKQSKHNITDITNSNKLCLLDSIFVDYKLLVDHYMSLILNKSLPFKTNLSSKLLPTYGCITHSKWKRECYKKASMIINSSFKSASNQRYKRYKKVYTYFKKNNRQIKFINKRFSELDLNQIIYTKYLTKPTLTDITIELGKEFIDIKEGNHFDNFVKIITPYIPVGKRTALQVKIPLKQHRHSNKLIKNGFTFKGSISLKKRKEKFYIHLNMEKDIKQNYLTKINGLGIDVGFKKLISTSRNEFIGVEMNELYTKMIKKVQGSKAFKRSLIERDNLTNFYCNQIDLTNINLVAIEALKDLKKGKDQFKSKKQKEATNKLQRWSYVKTLDKIKGLCDENGIKCVEVQPAYTSQTCSRCHNIDKDSRQGENYHCVNCGYQIDADYNAAINILNRGAYSLSSQKK